VPLAYGIRKLQISCVVEDEKVSVDWLQENIESIENYVSTVKNSRKVMACALGTRLHFFRIKILLFRGSFLHVHGLM
jgi:Translation elongation factor EF-1beta